MTRWVAVSLLVFNILVLGWMFDVARYSQPPAPPVQAGEAIRLASELVAQDTTPDTGRSGFSPTAPPEPIATLPAESPAATVAAELPAEPPPESLAATDPTTPTAPDMTADATADTGRSGFSPTASPEPVATLPPEPPPEPVATTPPEPLPTCVRIGPFERQQTARKLKTWLTEHGGEVAERQESSTGGQPARTWLYLGPYPNFTAARIENDRLSELGLEDVLAVRHKELGPVVSLGLFATESGLKARLKQLAEHKIEAERKQSYPEGQAEYWLDVRFPAASPFDAALFETVADPKLAVQADCG